MTDVTRILNQIEHGDKSTANQLLPLIYQELRKLAAAKMSQEAVGQTIQSTALVHEAYVRLVDTKKTQNWDSRGHFFAAAAEAMRRILIDRARRRKTLRAGGEFVRIDFSGIDSEMDGSQLDILALDEALERLSNINPRKSKLVKLRFFAGLTVEQAAKTLGISTATAIEDWAYAKCWLRFEMSESE